MKLLVLAGGFGTRLKTAVGDVPKALAPVNGAPFLRMQLEHWLTQGIQEFVFLLHHEADQIIAFLKTQQSGLLQHCQVDWLVETTPLDTGGAIANAVRRLELKGNFLATNADTWLGAGMLELMQGAAPSMAVVNLEDVSRYGQVEFDQESCVVNFSEKSGMPVPGWINAGIFYLDAELFATWDGGSFSLERTLLAELVQTRRLKAVPLQTDFMDIGVPADYRRFCKWVESGRKTHL